MASRDLYFWRLDAHQATLALGIFQIVVTALVYLGISSGVYYWLDHNPKLFESVDVDLCMAMFTIAYCFITTVFHVTLTIGALKGIRCLMLPWLIVAWLSIPLMSLSAITNLFILPFGSAHQIYTILFDVCHVGASSYCVFVVTKSFQSLGQARTNAIAIYNRGASQNLPVNSDNKENVQLQP